uniref:Uncharacterized protein n=1 Tax=Arundo donax TaxID=35708 RepID=A0A0A9FNG5_ARUDO
MLHCQAMFHTTICGLMLVVSFSLVAYLFCFILNFNSEAYRAHNPTPTC